MNVSVVLSRVKNESLIFFKNSGDMFLENPPELELKLIYEKSTTTIVIVEEKALFLVFNWRIYLSSYQETIIISRI